MNFDIIKIKILINKSTVHKKYALDLETLQAQGLDRKSVMEY